MNITLRQLRVFEAAARHLSYTRAAEELHLTQPAVSMQIKQLESTIGLPLFEQQGKKLYLTEAGHELKGYSRRVAQLLEEVDEVMQQIKGVHRGRLSVSVATTASYFATRLLAAFSREYPGISISLDVTNRDTLYRQLENNECDMVIMGRPPQEMPLDAEAFMENPLVMVAACDHPLARESQIPLDRFAEEKFVVREIGSGTRKAIERHFHANGVPFNTGMEMTSNEAIKQAVEAGLGLAVVSLHTLELELETRRLCLLDVVGFPIRRHWYLAHIKDKRLSPVANAFREFVLAGAEQYLRLPVGLLRGGV